MLMSPTFFDRNLKSVQDSQLCKMATPLRFLVLFVYCSFIYAKHIPHIGKAQIRINSRIYTHSRSERFPGLHRKIGRVMKNEKSVRTRTIPGTGRIDDRILPVSVPDKSKFQADQPPFSVHLFGKRGGKRGERSGKVTVSTLSRYQQLSLSSVGSLCCY